MKITGLPKAPVCVCWGVGEVIVVQVGFGFRKRPRRAREEKDQGRDLLPRDIGNMFSFKGWPG